MRDQGEIWSCDLHPHKKTLIQKGASAWASPASALQTADGKVRCPEWEGAFDRVLVDAPCSGLGVIRKKPDIRFKDPEPLAGAAPGAERHSGQRRRLCEARGRAGLLHLHDFGAGKPGGHRRLPGRPPGVPPGEFSSARPGGGGLRGGRSPCGPRSTGRTAFTSASCERTEKRDRYQIHDPGGAHRLAQGAGRARIPGQADLPLALPGGHLL